MKDEKKAHEDRVQSRLARLREFEEEAREARKGLAEQRRLAELIIAACISRGRFFDDPALYTEAIFISERFAEAWEKYEREDL